MVITENISDIYYLAIGPVCEILRIISVDFMLCFLNSSC
jgi:hypothetical protein